MSPHPHNENGSHTEVTNTGIETSHSPVPSNVAEVEADIIEKEPVLIPEDRRISWIGWFAAILIFIVNRKLGIALFAALIVLAKFPTINLKHLPKKTGSLFRKLRS